jgi:hypothetical protein
MAGSNWNRWHDALLAQSLTVAEHRLALALGRLILGWNYVERDLGRALICEVAGGMDRRTFERARAGLVSKGLIRYTPGSAGRGRRSSYALILDGTEKAAVERPFDEPEKAAVERPKARSAKGRSGDRQKAAAERPRIGRKGKTSPATPGFQELVAQAIDTYRGHGGTLELSGWNNILARQVATAARDGHDQRTILAVCSDLGRERAFPGYLKRRVEELAANGGPCHWQAFNRSDLSPERLRQCGCPKCEEWATAKAAA